MSDRLDGGITVNNRDENGRFVKGNSASPGRPRRKKEERFMEVAISAVSLKDWRAIIKKAVNQAIKGDNHARKFLADYLLGPPQQKIDVTSAGERIKTYIGISPDDWDE